jgi:hypothetical protein
VLILAPIPLGGKGWVGRCGIQEGNLHISLSLNK